MLALLMPLVAEASGRFAIGIDAATGWAPSEPRWGDRGADGAAVGCVGLVGDRLYGGHDFAGSHGQVLRSRDDYRWGVALQRCTTGDGGHQGSVGGLYGGQWGGPLYFTATAGAGVAVFSARGPRQDTYLSVAPYLEPGFRLGLALPPGLSVEAGPYVRFAPPVLQVAQGLPRGKYVGDVGLELTVLAGAASPRATRP